MLGFKTANEPLLMSQPEELAHLGLTIAAGSEAVSHPLATASLGYVKGFARSLTIITVLHWCWIKGYDLSMLNPTLYSSVLTVYGHYYPQESKVEESLKNMRISCAGSIRRPPNVIQTVSTIHKLVTKGGLKHYQDYVRRWNRTAPRAFQIVGQRATSLKLLFELAPLNVVGEIMDHIGRTSFAGSAWTDDNLSSKKMYPGYTFPTKGKTWMSSTRRVTKETMLLHIRKIHSDHESTPACMRKKLPNSEIVVWAERAALCWHLGQEFLKMVPISQCKLESSWAFF